MEVRYYSIDIAGVPFRYLVHAISPMMPKLLAWLVAAGIRIAGKFGKRLPPTEGTGFPGTQNEVDVDLLPVRAVARWSPILEQLKDLGFEPLKCEISDNIGAKRSSSVTLLDQEGTTVAIVVWSAEKNGDKIEETTPLEFNSYCTDAPDIVTGVVRELDVPMAEILKLDSVEMINLANDRPLAERYEEHRQRCREKPIAHMTRETALQLVRQRAQQRFEGMMQQGILRELIPKDIKRLRSTDVPELQDY